MGFFDRFRRTPAGLQLTRDDSKMRHELVQLVTRVLQDKDGRVRAEDAISAAATIVAERCIDTAGDFSLRDHDMPPGQRAFSTKANELICGDAETLDQVPSDSIVGWLRARLNQQAYADADFPLLADVFKYFAARIGEPKDWGKIPLSVPEDHFPFVLPLQIGYDTRSLADQILEPIRDDKRRCLRIATESLADFLNMVASVINPRVALLLAIETINGMAKTAPMTMKAMQQVQAKQNS